ncbi:hypothetical protein QE359_002591 [Curtobacterium sp. SORGH_AS776]|nr:hypothetical protein [Curtobacterium sp. SORGH_AS_0776]
MHARGLRRCPHSREREDTSPAAALVRCSLPPSVPPSPPSPLPSSLSPSLVAPCRRRKQASTTCRLCAPRTTSATSGTRLPTPATSPCCRTWFGRASQSRRRPQQSSRMTRSPGRRRSTKRTFRRSPTPTTGRSLGCRPSSTRTTRTTPTSRSSTPTRGRLSRSAAARNSASHQTPKPAASSTTVDGPEHTLGAFVAHERMCGLRRRGVNENDASEVQLFRVERNVERHLVPVVRAKFQHVTGRGVAETA